MPHMFREPVVTSRSKPTGHALYYPTCSDWSCDDDQDWDVVRSDDEDYAAIKRESELVYFHEPRKEWHAHLEKVRAELSGGDPLWWGRPPGVVTAKKMQCKDISDEVFLGLVARLEARNGMWVNWGEIVDITEWPWKLVIAKARKLIIRGLLDGCYCSCRGDFELTVKGRHFLKKGTM